MNEREEDKKWRDSVNDRLVSLTSAQKNSDDQMDDMDLEIIGLKETLNGDPKERDGGMIGQVNRMETTLNALNRIMQPDSLKEGGMYNEFQALKRAVYGKEKTQELRWSFLNSATISIASIIVALISSAVLLVTQWDKVSEFLRHQEKTSPVQQMINGAEHPKRKHRHAKAKAQPPAEVSSEPADSMPTLLDDDGADRR